jgi:glycosyltransferase involved in cell wall biosynthesis
MDLHETVKQYAVNTLVKTNHLGPARAFNEGFVKSKGEFVVFCDDDLELEANMIERLVNVLVKNPSKAYAYCGFVLTKEDGHQQVVGMIGFDAQRLIEGNYISGTSLIRRSKFMEVGMFDASFRRLIDWDLWLSLMERGEEGILVPEILFKHLRVKGPKISDDYNPESVPYPRAHELVVRKHLTLFNLARLLHLSSACALGPMYRLLAVYGRRPDLQSEFPEVKKGHYSRLLHWAKEHIATGLDSASAELAQWITWFRENEWLNVEEELSKARVDLTDREARIESLIGEKTHLEEELAETVSATESLRAERTALVEELDKAQATLSDTAEELEVIMDSFGYRFMRFYATRIDRFFPEGTRRGRLWKKIATHIRARASALNSDK